MTMRNSFDIQADILEVAMDGSKKTQLVYCANLNFTIIKRHLKNLLAKKLLKHEGDIYTTTEQGFKYLQNYRTLVGT